MASLEPLKIAINSGLFYKGIETACQSITAELMLLQQDGLEHECPLSEIIDAIKEVHIEFKEKQKAEET